MDILTKALAAKYTNQVALGLSNVEVNNVNKTVTFTLNNGETASLTFDQPSDGVSITDVTLDEASHEITVSFSDGTSQMIGVIPTAKGEKGDPGNNGKSAYEIAVQNGYSGTETEWLETLKGTNIDMTEYYTKSETDEAIGDISSVIDTINGEVN